MKQIGNDNVSVANFTVAVDRDFGEGADFYDVVAWRKLAENVGQYLGKGRLVYVEGRMQKRTYDAKLPGTETTYPRDVWEIQAEKCQFLDKGNSNAPGNANQAAPSGYANQNQTQQPAYNNAPAPF